MSFGGVDNRLNNITVDGSSFNNSFGLAAPPAIAQVSRRSRWPRSKPVQVNIAPFDVRQGNFVGAGVNTVTRSGTNSFAGSLYYQFRDESLVGTKAKDLTYNPGTFNYSNLAVVAGRADPQEQAVLLRQRRRRVIDDSRHDVDRESWRRASRWAT